VEVRKYIRGPGIGKASEKIIASCDKGDGLASLRLRNLITT
jgi:hypothetical protein